MADLEDVVEAVSSIFTVSRSTIIVYLLTLYVSLLGNNGRLFLDSRLLSSFQVLKVLQQKLPLALKGGNIPFSTD